MNISNKKLMLTSLLIGCSLIFLLFIIISTFIFIPLYREYSAYQIIHAERVSRLHILLCEEIQLGMTKEQVINILEQKGEIRINGNYDGPNLNLDFVYMDPTLNEHYGRFYIVIHDYIYVTSSVSTGFESYEIICSTYDWLKD